MGARYGPCMKSTNYDNNTFGCLRCSSTSLDLSTIPSSEWDPSNQLYIPCTAEDYCGMFKFNQTGIPDQWWRLISAIFMHGGVIHLAMNVGFFWQTGTAMEENYGTWRIVVIYFLSGIGGFMFGNTVNNNAPTVGASGSIFGILGVVLLDLLLNFKLVQKRWKELGRMILMIIGSLAFGLLPLIDNFAHLGGFVIGVISGLLLIPSITFGKWDARLKTAMRIGSLPLLLAFFSYLGNSYFGYTEDICTWCKYLDCVPINGWCD
jgi:membrane associated rhomboid family serine protease